MSSNALFRQQAIEAKANTLFGGSVLATPVRFKIIAAIGVAAAGALLAVVFFGTFANKQTVRGFVTTTQAGVRVFPSAAGVIAEIYVADGDLVAAGQALAKVSTSTSVSTRATQTVQAERLESMRSEAALLREQISRERDTGTSREEAIARKIENTLFQIGAIKQQIGSAAERRQLAVRASDRVNSLHSRNLVSDADIDGARTRMLDGELQLSAFERELATYRATLEQLQFDLERAPAESANRVAELLAALQRVQQRIVEVEASHARIVMAPIDGKIGDLGRRVGQRISTDMPLLSLLPSSTDYYAQLYVPSRSIGFVHEGSEIRLRYDAYPYQKYGVFDGIVERVTATPIRRGEADAPIELFESSYILQVSLDHPQTSWGDETLELRAGMTLQADILRGERRIIDWLLGPIAGAIKRSQ